MNQRMQTGENMSRKKIIASLDIGSNSLILLIASCDAENINPINEVFAICRLGENVNQTGRLAEAPMQRTLDAIAELQKIADKEKVEEMIVTATSAVRDAENRSEFLVRCHQHLDIYPQVLSGREEARFTYLGATAEIPQEDLPILTIDVGGGSTEIAFGTRERMNDAFSFDLGCVRLNEMFSLEQGYHLAKFMAAAKHIKKSLLGNKKQINQWLTERRPQIVLSGGTATTYAAILLEQYVFDREQINRTRGTRKALSDFTVKLAKMPIPKRCRLPGMEIKRAEIMPAGLLIFSTVLKFFGIKDFNITGNGLRMGILRNYVSKMF